MRLGRPRLDVLVSFVDPAAPLLRDYWAEEMTNTVFPFLLFSFRTEENEGPPVFYYTDSFMTGGP
jgi:hypothetical protein